MKSNIGRKQTALPQIEIQSPCPKNWDEMQGTDSKRYCDHCEKHVHRLAEMQEYDVAKLFENPGENVCVVMRKRADGTIVTRPTVLSRRSWLTRMSAVAASLFAIVTLGCRGESEPFGSVSDTSQTPDSSSESTSGEEKMELMGDAEVMGGAMAPPNENPAQKEVMGGIGGGSRVAQAEEN